MENALKQKNIRLTVILPIYNAMPFLKESVKSLQKQTFNDFIVLLINNGSTDSSWDYIASIKDERFICYEIKEANLVKALNFGLSLAKTEFVARMDADDISHPKRFEKQIQYMDNNKHIGVLGAQANYFGNSKRKIKINLPKKNNDIIQKMLNSENAMIHPTILYRTNAINGYKYNEQFFPCEDFEFYLRVSQKTKFANLEERLLDFRVHPNSIISLHIQKSAMLYQTISKKYFQKLFIESSFRYNINSNLQIWLNSKALVMYRKGLVEYLNNSAIIGIVFFIVATILNPKRGIKYIQKKVSLDSLYKDVKKTIFKEV